MVAPYYQIRKTKVMDDTQRFTPKILFYTYNIILYPKYYFAPKRLVLQVFFKKVRTFLYNITKSNFVKPILVRFILPIE